MVGGGPFSLSAGQWTDDTSMALCLAVSLIERGGFDASDQMRRYLRWWRKGYLSSTVGPAFDIGVTVSGALSRFERTGEPYAGSTDPHSRRQRLPDAACPCADVFLRQREGSNRPER